MKLKELSKFLDVPVYEYNNFKDIIEFLKSEGDIIITSKGKIILPKKLNLLRGRFQSNPRGFGFVLPDDNINNKEDVFIPLANSNGAMNKDIVFYKILPNSSRRGKPEGKIVSIVKRGYETNVGIFQKSKGFGFVVLDDPKEYYDVYISAKNSMNAMDGEKVIVKIIKPPYNNKKPEGKIISILGYKDDPGVDILSIVNQYNLNTEFPESVNEEAQNISLEISKSDLNNRTDLRDIKMVTIDGEDAKDLDDAVSLEILKNGNFQLGVHIADVANYVKENSELDKEALRRGTSVYFVDRVIPMLPKKLSNGICSLNANEDRLALSCIMEIDSKGEVISHKVLETIINVDKRMSYNQVNDILLNKMDDISPYSEFISMFKNMEKLCNILLNKRKYRGSIEFDFPEAKILLDENGKPTEIKIYERNFATSIIEEFMLVCNETIAEEYFWLDVPFVFRSHENPDSEKLEKLSEFISHFGYNLKRNATHPKSIQNLLSKFESTPEEIIVSRVVLRSLKQAKYTPNNNGHFGLAARYYCHFTSPIRRYPDLQIHRIIKENIRGKLNNKRIEHYNKIMSDVCKQSSITERNAEEAERESINLKKVEFMKDKIGETFEGIISGVTSWGIYVELPNTIEGMVSIVDLEDDFYIFDETKLRYIGENNKKTYSLGDSVKVILTKANLDTRKLDFKFVD